MMSIYHENRRISAKMRLKALGVPKEEPMRIVQKKMPLNNIEGVKAYM